ncbi:MAG: nucleoside recognition domain-containing protein [bacterium]|nr:nucleoside recognition domain-containing protein [bacterium]
MTVELLRPAIDAFSHALVPFLFVAIPVFAVARRVKLYEEFIEGAKGGFEVALRIIPYLVAILVAIGMFRASGALDLLAGLLAPLTAAIGFPVEALPAALMRPLSGSGSLGLVTELIQVHGPDSFIGRLASTMYGSTETTFYVLAVYFGSVGIRRTRHALIAGLLADAAGLLAALWICRVMFG